MADIDFVSLFNRVGQQGNVGYTVAQQQALIPTILTELWELYENTDDLDLIGSFTQSQAGIVSSMSGPGSQTSGLAQTTAQRMVATSVPSLSGSTAQVFLTELIRQMKADSKTVPACAITATGTVLGTNVGNGVLVTTTKRGDGLVQENTVAESLRLQCANDSYTGGATQGQETFQVAGAPNTADTWDYNWPNGSGQITGFNAISASNYGNTNGNLLTNGDFATWSGSPASPSSWSLSGGTWGTDIAQDNTNPYAGTYAVKFLAGTGTTEILFQTFGTNTSATPSPLNSYIVNLFARKESGTITGGVLTIELTDGSGTVINDQQGVANSTTLTLSTLTTSYAPVSVAFRIPEVPPSSMLLRLRISTALTGANFLIDSVCFGKVTSAYPGGFGLCVFSGSTPFVKNDGWDIATTNNYAGASYGGTFQTLFDRVFGMRGLNMLLPSGATPTFPNSMITFPGLTAYYRFNSSLADSSGNGVDLTVNTGTPAYSAGKIGNCLGTASATCIVTRAMPLQGDTGTVGFSWGGWFKWGTGGNANLQLLKSDASPIFHLEAIESGGSTIDLQGGLASLTYTTGLSTGTWYFIVAVSLAGTCYLYVNGTLVASGVISDETFDSNGFFRPLVTGGGSDSFLDECFILQRSLSLAEIAYLYNSGTGIDPTS